MKIPDHLLIDYLEERLDSVSSMEVEKWLKNSENSESFEVVKKIWLASKSAKIFNSIDTEKALNKTKTALQEQTNIKQIERSSMPILRIAASIAVILGIGLALYFNQSRNQWIEVQTNEVAKEYLLPDGSNVTINRNSILRVKKDMRETRELVLMGEAFFEVTRDTLRPFRVEAEGVDVTVLGTSFNIKSGKEEAIVTVASGKVRVTNRSSPDQMETLLQNEAAIFKVGMLAIGKLDPNYSSWKTGVFTFDKTPVKEALRILAKHYNKTISISESDLIDCTISSTFEKQSWEDIENELSLVLSLKFEKEENGMIAISGPGCKR